MEKELSLNIAELIEIREAFFYIEETCGGLSDREKEILEKIEEFLNKQDSIW